MQDNKDILLFVDRNPLYYERKWGKKEDPSKGISWNFVAFFFSTYWFAYRKMYMWMFLDFLLSFVGNIGVLLLLSVTPLSEGAQVGIWLLALWALKVVFGLYGNTLYYRHVQKKLERIEQSPSLTPEMKQFMITRTGGVNRWAVVAVIVVYFFFSLVSNFVGQEVQVQDQNIKANNSSRR
jgi:hypothetical protein